MSVTARKIATIVRCIERAREERVAAGQGFSKDYSRQDAAILNITRACEAAVDLANMLIRKRRLGVPGDMKESFFLLQRAALITPELFERMKGMVGFRNLAIHQYQDINLEIVEAILRKDLDDLLALAQVLRPHLDQ